VPEGVTGRLISDDRWGILCVYAEARSEPYEGQVAVGNVIRNRTARKFFSDGTVCGTVTYPYQFSWLNTNDRQRSKVLGASWEDVGMRLAAKAWFESEHNKIVKDALLYHADYVDPTWSKAQGIELVSRIGRHLFYRDVHD
jgi:spore germination cell wall hydrolase CwlJ-like protein